MYNKIIQVSFLSFVIACAFETHLKAQCVSMTNDPTDPCQTLLVDATGAPCAPGQWTAYSPLPSPSSPSCCGSCNNQALMPGNAGMMEINAYVNQPSEAYVNHQPSEEKNKSK